MQLHTVRHTLSRLEEAGALRRSWVVNVFKLGWLRVQMAAALGPAKRAIFENFFRREVPTCHITELGGRYDLELLFLARSPEDILQTICRASEVCDLPFAEHSITIQTKVVYFSRKYLATKSLAREAIVCAHDGPTYVLDSLEEQILQILMDKPNATLVEIGAQLRVSVPTVRSRLERLRRSGVIAGTIFSPSLIELGAQNFRIVLHTRGVTTVLRERIFKLAQAEVHCTSYREGIGAWDFELNIEIENYRQLNKLKDSIWKSLAADLHSMEVVPRLGVLFYRSYPLAVGLASGREGA